MQSVITCEDGAITTGTLDLPDAGRLEDGDAKDELRKILQVHHRAHHHHPAQEHTADCETLIEHTLKATTGVQRMAAFVSVGVEPYARLLLRRLHGGDVQAPSLMLGPRLARCWEPFQDDTGLAERAPRHPPEPNSPSMPAGVAGQVDTLIAPALAVSSAGRRLGQGGDWYDRILSPRSSEAHIFAILHPEELVPEPLPMGEHDEPVDAVITIRE